MAKKLLARGKTEHSTRIPPELVSPMYRFLENAHPRAEFAIVPPRDDETNRDFILLTDSDILWDTAWAYLRGAIEGARAGLRPRKRGKRGAA